MWHEARKQERKIRGMLVDYRRRAERRRDFYEKIKADPTQFMQLHGRSYKIHLDPNVAAAAESSSTMMPWQGQVDNMIDRFDARAHLDYIPTYDGSNDTPDKSAEERQCNYERYRVLVQNAFLGLSEEKFLRQLHLEEQYGYTADLDSSKKKKSQGATIGFNYDDDAPSHPQPTYKDNTKEESDDSDADVDFDLAIDVSKIEMSQAHELNKYGQNFGMSGNDFYSFLTNDMEEAENLRAAREEEEERALYSGRRSRRARRAHQEKRLHNRIISPPSYAAKEPDKEPLDRRSRSTSKSVSPVNAGEITYITSFGDDDNDIPSVPARPPTYADKVKAGPSKNAKRKSSERRIRYRSHSKDRKRRLNSSSRSRSRSRRRSRSTSTSRRSRYHRRSRSRSYTYRGGKNRKSNTSSLSSSSRSRSRSVVKKVRSPSASSTSSSESSKKSSNHKSPSKNNTPEKMETDNHDVISKPLPRYYGRRKSDKSSSEIDDLSDDDDSESNKDIANMAPERKLTGLVNSKTGASSKQGNTQLKPQERLKRKMQILLNKQYKADKKAQQLRNEKLEQEARERDDQMREMALKLRRRQRMKNYGDSSNSNSDSEGAGDDQKDDTLESHPKSPSSNHSSIRIHRSPVDYRRDRDHSNDRHSKHRKTSREERYRDRSRDRDRRRRYSDDDRDRDRSSRSHYRSSRRDRTRSKSNDSRGSSSRRRRRSSDNRRRDNSSNRRPLVDY